jgi:hypothetical protein
MAYYLGRDVLVALTTEDTGYGLQYDVTGKDLQTYALADGPEAAADLNIAGPRALVSSTVFGTIDKTIDFINELTDVTGVDISIGTVDEDITYMGQRSVLKAEIKKETTITITRKKSDMSWDIAFNGDGTNTGRYGIKGDDSFHTGLEDPGVEDFGFRVYVKLNSSEYFVAPNCCMQAHSVTLNADGTTEETLELMTYLDPKICSAETDSTYISNAGAF